MCKAHFKAFHRSEAPIPCKSEQQVSVGEAPLDTAHEEPQVLEVSKHCPKMDRWESDLMTMDLGELGDDGVDGASNLADLLDFSSMSELMLSAERLLRELEDDDEESPIDDIDWITSTSESLSSVMAI